MLKRLTFFVFGNVAYYRLSAMERSMISEGRMPGIRDA